MKATAKVLLIEDDIDDRMLLTESFAASQTNTEIVYAENGDEAIRFLNAIPAKENYPCLIILDLNMPRRNGKETLSYLKASPELASIPVAVFSTSENRADMDCCWKLGAASYIQKPHHFDGYKAAVEKFISLMHITA
jgi:CheY-like chemotaxis protein